MIEHHFQDNSPSIFRRKLLQTNSSFDTSQPSFIALLCVISVLTFAFVITASILCYRFYSHRERRSRRRRKQRNRTENIFPPIVNPQSSLHPVSVTPTSASSYSARSSDQLVSNRQHQQSHSTDTLPSRRLQQSVLDAYLNDLNNNQPTIMDVKQLNSYLFVDLHSTSSETYPEQQTSSQPQTTRSHQIRNSRFVMRERSLPTHLTRLPQLRPVTLQEEKDLFAHDDSTNSSTINRNQELLSTTTTITDDYDDSHAYNVNQHQILQSIKEERPFFTDQHFPSISLRYEPEPFCFEIVSTTRDDSTEIPVPYPNNSIENNNFAFVNDSIIV